MRCSCSSNTSTRDALNVVARRKAGRLSTDLTGAYASGDGTCPSRTDSAVTFRAISEPSCGVRLLANAEGSKCHACDHGVKFGCSDRSSIWVMRGCRATFSCGPNALPFWCGQSGVDHHCECARVGDYCGQANVLRANGTFATANSPVPDYYLRAVYGASAAAAHSRLPAHQQLRLGALELLYSGMSVPAESWHTPSGGDGREVQMMDMVQTAVTGKCFAFTGGGDMHCCHSGLIGGSATFATTQGHLVYNPLCVRASPPHRSLPQ